MRPKLELALIVLVCAFGLAYFGWQAYHSEGDRQLFYIALQIVSLIIGQRAIKDVRAKVQGGDGDQRGR